MTSPGPVLPRNDVRQYDQLVEHWWRPGGRFAALHWLARSRGALVPPAHEAADRRVTTSGTRSAQGPDRRAPDTQPQRQGIDRPAQPGGRATGSGSVTAEQLPVLVDVGCGGGLLAEHVTGYRHVGVDLVASALRAAAAHGVTAIAGDAARLPLRDGVADVVAAGEIFEHVTDLDAVVAEVARILRPGGTVVFDTINDSTFARLGLVTIAERLPGGPPHRIHDPALFVRPERLRRLFADHGVTVACWGLRPSALDYLRFLPRRRRPVRMVPTRSLAGVYQGTGRKADR